MARTTGTNWDVTHVWAQDSTANMRSSSMSAEGPFLRSYRAVIGRWVSTPGRNPKRISLLTSEKFSVTTSAHVSKAHRALKYTGFTVPFLGNEYTPVDHKANVTALAKRATDTARKAMRSRDHAEYMMGDAQRQRGHAELYASTFRVRITKAMFPAEVWDALEPTVERIKARVAELQTETLEERDKRLGPARAKAARERDEARERARERQAEITRKWQEEQAERERIRALDRPERRKAWLRGEGDTYSYDWQDGEPVPLRVKGNYVETARGATFPLSDAIRVFRILERVRQRGIGNILMSDWANEDMTLGHFKVEGFDGNAIIAGCHVVMWDDAVRLMHPLTTQE